MFDTAPAPTPPPARRATWDHPLPHHRCPNSIRRHHLRLLPPFLCSPPRLCRHQGSCKNNRANNPLHCLSGTTLSISKHQFCSVFFSNLACLPLHLCEALPTRRSSEDDICYNNNSGSRPAARQFRRLTSTDTAAGDKGAEPTVFDKRKADHKKKFTQV